MTQIRCVRYARFKLDAMSIGWMEQSLNKFSLSAFDICATHCAHHIALRYGGGGRRIVWKKCQIDMLVKCDAKICRKEFHQLLIGRVQHMNEQIGCVWELEFSI